MKFLRITTYLVIFLLATMIIHAQEEMPEQEINCLRLFTPNRLSVAYIWDYTDLNNRLTIDHQDAVGVRSEMDTLLESQHILDNFKTVISKTFDLLGVDHNSNGIELYAPLHFYRGNLETEPTFSILFFNLPITSIDEGLQDLTLLHLLRLLYESTLINNDQFDPNAVISIVENYFRIVSEIQGGERPENQDIDKMAESWFSVIEEHGNLLARTHMAPNLTSSSGALPFGSGPGGPGGLPVKNDDQAESYLDFSNQGQDIQDGDGVTVAILDTPIINSSTGTPKPTLYGDINVTKKHGYVPGNFTRDRVDHPECNLMGVKGHGTFIAGLVRALAPAAKIHSYEALNEQGYGTLESTVRALHAVYTQHDFNAPLIVNLSFNMSFFHNIAELGDNYTNRESVDQILLNTEVQKDIKGSPVQNGSNSNLFATVPISITEWFQVPFALPIYAVSGWGDANANVVIVGAAGNNAINVSGHPSPEFPAYLNEVIAVAAHDHLDKLANYSNHSDCFAFGGTLGINMMAHQEYGILGIHPGLDGGVARWAGTSFATAVVSGTFAAEWNGNGSWDSTQNICDKAAMLRQDKDYPYPIISP